MEAVQMTIYDFLSAREERYVKRISYDATKPFILGIHYARRMPCVQYAYGLYEGGC